VGKIKEKVAPVFALRVDLPDLKSVVEAANDFKTCGSPRGNFLLLFNYFLRIRKRRQVILSVCVRYDLVSICLTSVHVCRFQCCTGGARDRPHKARLRSALRCERRRHYPRHVGQPACPHTLVDMAKLAPRGAVRMVTVVSSAHYFAPKRVPTLTMWKETLT